MSYKALYRKYRPLTFDDVRGQDHIVLTLKNIIASQKIGHAYLFAGPRGTGKTSVANVFAMEVNRNAVGEVVANKMDIIEIDAASNNGVAEIRTIIDNSKYAPTEAKYKVYIIDEVHMLTKGAFNALLKTLEEPPLHVIFILATTEAYKIPVTILSRTQRFNFRRISDDVIKEQLQVVLKQENIGFDQEAIRLIAKLAQGGMRDALSIADQTAAFGGGNISFAAISQVFGTISIDNQIKILNLAAQNQAQKLLSLSAKFIDNGSDIERLTISLIDVIKDFIIYKKTQDYKLLTSINNEEINSLAISINFAYEALDVLVKLLSDLRFSYVPQQSFELALLKMTKEDQKPKDKSPNNHLFEKSYDQKPQIITQNLDQVISKPVANAQETSVNDLNKVVASTQDIQLHEIDAIEKTTEEIDLIKMFDSATKQLTNETVVASDEQIIDQIINLLVQADKSKVISDKEILSNITDFADDAKSSTYVQLLNQSKIIASGPGFILVTSHDSSVVSQLRQNQKKQSFINFITRAFKVSQLIFAVDKVEFTKVKATWTALKKTNSLPLAKPIEQVQADEDLKSDEEKFGENIFGNLFS